MKYNSTEIAPKGRIPLTTAIIGVFMCHGCSGIGRGMLLTATGNEMAGFLSDFKFSRNIPERVGDNVPKTSPSTAKDKRDGNAKP